MAAIVQGPQIIDGQFTSLINVPSATVTAGGTTGTSTAGVPVGDVREILACFSCTAVAGSGTTVPHIDTLGVDGVWYHIWSGSAMAAAGTQVASIGVGCATNISLGAQIRVSWDTFSGTSVTFSASVMGR